MTRPGAEQLWTAISELEPYGPTFVSVTYGAGGTTRDTTVQLTGRIARETSLVPMGHLTCVGHTRAELDRILDDVRRRGRAQRAGAARRPDGRPAAPTGRPPRAGSPTPASWCRCASARATFTVGVAAFPGGHPGAESVERDTEVLLEKQRAGAEFAITDMVFRAADYSELVERARRPRRRHPDPARASCRS